MSFRLSLHAYTITVERERRNPATRDEVSKLADSLHTVHFGTCISLRSLLQPDTCTIQDSREPFVAWVYLPTRRTPPLLSTLRCQSFRNNGRVQDRRRRGREHHYSSRKTILFSKLLKQWRCVFCQDHRITYERDGPNISPEELATWHVKLQEVGNVHGIDSVTPEHVVTQVNLSILHAKMLGTMLCDGAHEDKR
jgi:hypothetical protein